MGNNLIRREPLGQQVEKASTSTDIALPEPQLKILREIAVSAGRPLPVSEDRQPESTKLTTHGTVALFSGANSAGKTTAAGVLSRQLGLELYRIDMKQVVGKYVGETEKNLSLAFAEAERQNAILFFDEADALFGKRTEVKDSHDRYANIEISYFLQQVKQHHRLVVLAAEAPDEWAPSMRQSIKFMVNFSLSNTV